MPSINKTSDEIDAAANIDAAMQDERYKAGYNDATSNTTTVGVLTCLSMMVAGYVVCAALGWLLRCSS